MRKTEYLFLWLSEDDFFDGEEFDVSENIYSVFLVFKDIDDFFYYFESFRTKKEAEKMARFIVENPKPCALALGLKRKIIDTFVIERDIFEESRDIINELIKNFGGNGVNQ